MALLVFKSYLGCDLTELPRQGNGHLATRHPNMVNISYCIKVYFAISDGIEFKLTIC